MKIAHALLIVGTGAIVVTKCFCIYHFFFGCLLNRYAALSMTYRGRVL